MKAGIVFDLDGTLLDTLEDLYQAVNYALRLYGCPERSRQDVRKAVGNGARSLIQRSLPGEKTDPPLERILADYQAYYDTLCVNGRTCPYPGIPEQLALLQKTWSVAIVSNKPDISVKPLCEKFFPGIYALGSLEGCPQKPAPDMVLRAVEAIGVEKCVYVGDSEVDIATAKNTGVPCLSVLWGFRDRDALVNAGAVHFCEKVEDMQCAVKKLIQNEL